ncbi:MAG TPA: DNA polymerase III subunit gamma/tau [Terriglobales bacterium]|nr:DNA polymerase III subunit gamma/tau [Terriglobales bacterium]
MPPVIARRYRPQSFEEVIGQDAIVRTLRNAIAGGRIAHGFIFSGHRGIGKTTVARILAKALNCRASAGPTATPCGECESCREIRDGNAVDVIEIDAASNRGIDEIRALRDRVRYRPARDRYKFFILDEAHQLTGDAFNALLKTLEEPPEWAVFVLATTEPEALPATIRSRCQHFAFRAVGFRALLEHLAGICRQEGVAAEAEALELIAEAGEGSVRDALSLLDQAITHASAAGGEQLTGESVRALLGRVSPAAIGGLLDQVAADSARGLLESAQALQAAGNGPAQLCWQLAQAVRNALLAQASPDLLETSESGRAAALKAAGQFREEELARFLQILLRAAADLRHGEQERLHFELALVKLLHARRLNSIEDVIASLQGGEEKAQLPRVNKDQPSMPSPAPARSGKVAAPATDEGNPTARVRRQLEEQGKAALLTVVAPAQWDWQENRLTLIFAGEQAAMASLAASSKSALALACRAALGRNIEVEIAARPGESAPAAAQEAALPGSAEERAAGHPLLRQLREQIPTHVLKTRTLSPSEGAR